METIIERPAIERRKTNSAYLRHPVRISWGAVFAGVVMAIAAQVLLGALGFGAIAWLFASVIVAYAVSSWVAMRMIAVPTWTGGLIHGLLIWAFSTMVMLLVLSVTFGSVRAGSSRLFGVTHVARPAATINRTTVKTQRVTPERTVVNVNENMPAEGPAAVTENQRSVDAGRGADSELDPFIQERTIPAQTRTIRQTKETVAAGPATAAAGTISFFLLLVAGVSAALGGRWGERRTYTAA